MTTRYNLLFCLLFGAMCVVYRYDQWLTLPPAAIHQWRQADGYALSAHYARGAAFHAPMQYNLFTNGDNQTVGELPLLYWIAGTSIRCLGTSAYTLRWIGLAWMLAGAWVIGWVALRFTRKPVLAALLTALVHTAPILAYYGPGYLPDAPAFYLSILAGGSLFQAERQQRAGWLWIAGFFSALAIMIKISTVLLPGALFLAWLWGRMRGYWREHNIWGSWMPTVVACGVGAAVVACRWWITVYNDAHQAHYFLANIRPIWWYQLDAIRQILWGMICFGFPAYASAGLYLVVGKVLAHHTVCLAPGDTGVGSRRFIIPLVVVQDVVRTRLLRHLSAGFTPVDFIARCHAGLAKVVGQNHYALVVGLLAGWPRTLQLCASKKDAPGSCASKHPDLAAGGFFNTTTT
jgi:hypothetical protein